MSKTFAFLFILFSFSAVAGPVKKLVCKSGYVKIGLSSDSDDL